MVELARQRRPFLMNVQSNEVTRQRMDLYRRTLREQGCDEAAVASCVDDCWVWRNVVVAETDAEAARVGIPAFEAMQQQRAAMRERIYRETGQRLQTTTPGPMAPAALYRDRARVDPRLPGNSGGSTGEGGGNRHRRGDHAIPSRPDVS